MSRRLSVLLLVVFLTGGISPFQPVFAAPAAPQQTGGILCLPGIYLSDPGDCAPAGPSRYLTGLAEKGLTLPVRPLSYTPIDPALGNVNVRYAEVTTLPAPVFSSIDDAAKGGKKNAASRLDGSFVFISYTNEHAANGKRFYEIASGQWVTAAYVSRIGVIPPARGVTFNATPPTSFGWVLSYFAQSAQLDVQRTPGDQYADYSGRKLDLYDIIPIFGQQQVGEQVWYMIGPDEWVPARHIARVTPNTTPPQGVTGDRWIEINLKEQTLAVYDRRQLVFATIIASGADPFWTRPGIFQITEKLETTPMQGAFEGDRSDAYYLEDVPWTMYFDGARALHGAYWRAKMGYAQSHGCVNLTVADAHWLFDWAQSGDWVYVWDPSGLTPTDPSLYGAGGF